MKRLLLVEDDRSLGATLHERLLREKYDVAWVETKQGALANSIVGSARPSTRLTKGSAQILNRSGPCRSAVPVSSPMSGFANCRRAVMA